jgi:hypothetical protein
MTFNILQNIWYNSFEKYVDCDLATIVKFFKEEVKVRGPFERQIIKKIMNILGSAIFNFFSIKDHF